MRVGQILYNVYNQNTNSYFSTDKNGKGLVDSSNSDYNNNKIDICNSSINLVTAINSNINNFIRMGIQAPPKTFFIANGKRIMVGQTGIYELDPNIKITSLYFEKNNEVDLYNIIIDFVYLLEGEEENDL